MLIGTIACGCRSTRVAESSRAAAVIVLNRPAQEITAASKAVFQAHGYESAKPAGNELVFEKQGSTMNTFLRGDWYSGPVWHRIRVYMRELDANRTLLDCDRYLVQEPEDPLFQRERKLRGKDAGSQKLLEEIAAALTRKNPAP